MYFGLSDHTVVLHFVSKCFTKFRLKGASKHGKSDVERHFLNSWVISLVVLYPFLEKWRREATWLCSIQMECWSTVRNSWNMMPSFTTTLTKYCQNSTIPFKKNIRWITYICNELIFDSPPFTYKKYMTFSVYFTFKSGCIT